MGERISWRQLSLIRDETVINLQSSKVHVFSDSVLCLGRVLQHLESNEAWKNRIAGVKALLDSPLPFYFHLSFPVFFFSFHLLHSELYSEIDNPIVMESLCYSAKGSNDAYDVTFSLTGYEPNDTVFNELVDSQGPFSYITPSSDQDIDDTTLGKLLTEAWSSFSTKRMDSRKYEDWTCIGSHDQFTTLQLCN